MRIFFLLPDLDSNQDKQNQNLSYYHYTIGQPLMGCKNKTIHFHPKNFN